MNCCKGEITSCKVWMKELVCPAVLNHMKCGQNYGECENMLVLVMGGAIKVHALISCFKHLLYHCSLWVCETYIILLQAYYQPFLSL